MFDLITNYDPEEKFWCGSAKKPLFNEEISVGEIALYMLRSKNPQNVMQISDSEGITLTYGTVLTTAIRIAQHLRKMKLTADDVVGIFAPNTSYVASVAVAAMFNGTPFQATNCNLETSVIQHIYEFIQPKIIFCDGQYYEKVKEASKSFKPLIYTLCNHLVEVPKLEDLLEPTETEQFFQAEPLKYGPSQTMAIMISSGTTGLPKGVCVTNKACSAAYLMSNGSSVLFSTSTIDWSSGILTLLANILIGGTRIITSKPFTPEYLLDLITKYKINFLATNPEIMLQLSLLNNFSKETMQSIRLIFITGAFCSELTQKRIRSALTYGYLLYAYGTTEIGGVAGNISNYKLNSVGKILFGVQLKIVDPKTGERLGPLQTGEICVKPNNSWPGYYKNAEATKAIFDEEGFIKTGDLGYMDEEHYLYLTGRSKDIMKYMGYQYSPKLIEDIVLELPDVLDVCVFGVYDELKYDVPAAAVVKREGSSLTTEEIMAYVRSKTEIPQKQIHYGVFFLKELARNNNGKLLRNKVKDTCLAMESGTVKN